MTFQLSTEGFSGPIQKLLELIEGKQLAITQISLSKVTGDFLAYIKALEHVPPAVLADFVVVASQLLLIKSK